MSSTYRQLNHKIPKSFATCFQAFTGQTCLSPAPSCSTSTGKGAARRGAELASFFRNVREAAVGNAGGLAAGSLYRIGFVFSNSRLAPKMGSSLQTGDATSSRVPHVF